MSSFSLPKGERLSSKRAITRLFEEGKGGFVYPFRYVVTTEPEQLGQSPVSVLVSVSKRNHKRAVIRNLLKRRSREAYRLNKHLLTEGIVSPSINLGLMYASKEVEEYSVIENSVRKILSLLADTYCSTKPLGCESGETRGEDLR